MQALITVDHFRIKTVVIYYFNVFLYLTFIVLCWTIYNLTYLKSTQTRKLKREFMFQKLHH